MYKIHCGGYMRQYLFGDNLDELKKQVEQYCSPYIETLGLQFSTTGFLKKNVLYVKTYWKQYKNKFRYYEETICDYYQIDGTTIRQINKFCLETITKIK